MKCNHNHVQKGRCKVCNHHIWKPETLAAKIGPICASKGVGEAVSLEIQEEIRKLASQILNEQKKKDYRGLKAKAHSNLWLWKKNKKLIEGW
jgi:hypothetical protein